MSDIKQKLIDESKNIDLEVQLDSVFESVELSEDVKDKFSNVYETAVKSRAIALAEKHVEDLAEKAETWLEEAKQENLETVTEQVNDYATHVAKEWISENKLAVDNGLKAQLFDNLVGQLKEVFIDNNIAIPEDSVNIVEELEVENQELNDEISKFMEKTKSLTNEISEMNRVSTFDKAVNGLTEVQKDRVNELADGLDFNESYEGKLQSIVSMIKEADDDDDDSDAEDEKKKKKDKEDEDLDESAEGLNYPNKPSEASNNDEMSMFLKSAARHQ